MCLLQGSCDLGEDTGWRPKAQPYSERIFPAYRIFCSVPSSAVLQRVHSASFPCCLPSSVLRLYLQPVLSLAETLVDLMSAVVRLCPSVCESSHFAVLLGTYSATLSILGKEDLMVKLCGQGWWDVPSCIFEGLGFLKVAFIHLLDQKILLLLRAYEQNKLSLISFR